MPTRWMALLMAILFLLAAASAPAQDRFLPDQANGLGIHAMWLVPPGLTGPGFDVVGTFRTRLDVGFAYSHVSSEKSGPDNLMFSEVEESAAAPHVSFALVRPSRRSQYGFDLVAGSSFISGSGRYREQPNTDISGHRLVLGGEAYTLVGQADETRFFPSLGLAYAADNRTIDDSAQSTEANTDGLLVTASLTVLLGDMFTLGGGIRSFNDETTWIWRIGIVTLLD